MFVIGVDPGPTTGIVAITDSWPQPIVIQCDHWSAPYLIGEFIAGAGIDTTLAIERFVVNLRASRSAAAQSGKITRELIGVLVDRVNSGRWSRATVVQRSAAEVKPWATNERLDAAGLLMPAKGMPHAADAGRHALFAAVKDLRMRDPLSVQA